MYIHNKKLQVSDNTIKSCRNEIDGYFKSILRNIYLKFVKIRYGFLMIGEGFQIGFPIYSPRNTICAGRFSYIGRNWASQGPVFIGDLCMISTNVSVVGDDHVYDIVGRPTRLEFNKKERPPTFFEADCWIGSNVIIKEGVTIGQGAVVGAGAIVTKSLPPYSISVGVPAKVIGYRYSSEDMLAHEKLI